MWRRNISPAVLSKWIASKLKRKRRNTGSNSHLPINLRGGWGAKGSEYEEEERPVDRSLAPWMQSTGPSISDDGWWVVSEISSSWTISLLHLSRPLISEVFIGIVLMRIIFLREMSEWDGETRRFLMEIFLMEWIRAGWLIFK